MRWEGEDRDNLSGVPALTQPTTQQELARFVTPGSQLHLPLYPTPALAQPQAQRTANWQAGDRVLIPASLTHAVTGQKSFAEA